MFDIPESDVVGVRVDEETVNTSKIPEYIRARPTSSTDDSLEDSIKVQQDHDNKISLPTGWTMHNIQLQLII